MSNSISALSKKMDASFQTPAERMGYEIFGPLLLGFCRWVHRMSRECHVDTLLFLARDGLIIKRAYDLLFPDDDQQYFYISRRAAIVPLLADNLDIEEMLNVSGLPNDFTVRTFISKLGLDMAQVDSQAKQYDLAPETRLIRSDFANNIKLSKFYESIKEDVFTNSTDEQQDLKGYLRQELVGGEKYGLVDVGWAGSIQRALIQDFKLAGIDASTVGFYIGIKRSDLWKPDFEMYGFLFDLHSNPLVRMRQQIYNELYELFFSAPYGSVIRFRDGDEGYTPVLAKYEFEGTSYWDFFEQFQNGAIAYVTDARDGLCQENAELEPQALLKRIERIGLNPTYEEAVLFGNLPFLDYNLSYLAKPKPISAYLRHPNHFVNDFKNAWWKPGFAKRIFRLPINYGELMYQIKQHRSDWVL